jgi:uncharacterized hydrophobic protein (TIGR00271 family)
MYHIRVASPTESTQRILEILGESSGAVNVSVMDGAGRFPDGDIVECDLEPECANEVIGQLSDLGPRQRGPITVDRSDTAVIRSHREMVMKMISDREIEPVWEVVDATIRENASYPFSFYLLLVCAGLIAAVGIITNSQILIVGAMVVGPEYNAILGAALGLTKRKRRPVRRALTALTIGFPLAIVATFLLAGAIRASGQTPRDFLLGFRPVSDLISKPNMFSVIVAVVAGVVGVVSILEARINALIGVFISVTTIPAAAAMGVSAAYGQWDEAWDATEQLLLNVVILIGVGTLTLLIQRAGWARIEARRRRRAADPSWGQSS